MLKLTISVALLGLSLACNASEKILVINNSSEDIKMIVQGNVTKGNPTCVMKVVPEGKSVSYTISSSDNCAKVDKYVAIKQARDGGKAYCEVKVNGNPFGVTFHDSQKLCSPAH